MQFRRVTYSALAVAALFGFASASASAAVINFDQAGGASPEGSVIYNGDNGPLIGSDISFGVISLNQGGAPGGNETTLNCDGCTLDFQTGDNMTEGNGNTSNNNRWTFDGGGSLTLNGTAKDSGGNSIASGDLVTGSFTNQAGGSPQTVDKTGDVGLSVLTNGDDGVDNALLNYFGIDEDTEFMFSNTELALTNATFGDDGSFDSGDLQNADMTVTSAVPEPRELGLFAIGVILLAGGLGYRRRSSAFMP